MDVQLMSQLFGVSQYTSTLLKSGNLPGSLGDVSSADLFNQNLSDRMELYQSGDEVGDPMAKGWFLNKMNRNALMDKIMLGHRAAKIEDSDESITDDTETDDTEIDSLDSAETESNGTVNDDPTTESNGTVSVQSAKDIVYATAAENADLLNSISNASTYAERIQFAEQLRDEIIEALNAGGHEAYDIGKPDKISIDGELYDVIRRSRAIGKEASVQFMDVPAETNSVKMKQSILDAGEDMMDLLTQISESDDAAERRLLATQFRDSIIEKLNADGHEATGLSPDKISVDGQTYDILRSLNDPGSAVMFQAMKV